MYERIAGYEGITDISNAKHDHPIFNVRMLFSDLVYTEYGAIIIDEIPRITLKPEFFRMQSAHIME